MEYIEKINGEAWLVKEWDVYGIHKTKTFLGKIYEEEAKKNEPSKDEKKSEE